LDIEAKPPGEDSMNNEEFNLKDYLPYFHEIGRKRFGMVVDFDEIETGFRRIKERAEAFSADHLEALKKDCAFINWWKVPSLNQHECMEIQEALSSLKPRDKEGLFRINDQIKNIEIVSCILRVIDPMNYAVMSPPVENILSSQGKHQVDKYLNFLRDLEDLKDTYDFQRIADVDKALWTLANLVDDPSLRYTSETYRQLYDNYHETINRVKIIKARNALKPVLEDRSGYLDFAVQSINIDIELAGIFAGKELEHLVRKLCEENDIRTKWAGTQTPKKMHSLYIKLMEKRVIKPSSLGILDAWWKTRNESVHEDNLFKEESELADLKIRISEMIEGLKQMKNQYCQSERMVRSQESRT
jgi:hypothetical protein